MSSNLSVVNSTSNISSLRTPSRPKPSEKVVKFPLPETVKNPSWEKRTVAQLNAWDTALDDWMPNWVLQNKIDQLGTYIEEMFSSLPAFNSWLRSNGEGAWYTQLATYLAKLPLKAAHNIINLLYHTIKGILYGATHPLKGLNAIAKQLVLLAHALTQPETWSKIGAGVIGAGLGQALILSNPISVIAMGIGTACIIAGVSFGALKAAIEAEEGKKLDAVAHNFIGQCKQIPESLLTGFMMGLLIGGIKKMLTKTEPADSVLKTSKKNITKVQSLSIEEARIQAAEFAQQHHLPPPGHVTVTSIGTEFGPPGTIIIDYTQNIDFFMKSYFKNFSPSTVNLQDFKLYLQPDGNASLVSKYFMEGSSIEEYWPTETIVTQFKNII